MPNPLICERAPAKVNLTLHVTGRRADGYHELDSLVVFAPVHDTLYITEGNTLSLTIEGPESAGVPADMRNLVMRAAEKLDPGKGAAFTLNKVLPAAAGIGGGSSDAAAAIRGLMRLWMRDELDTMASDSDALLRQRLGGILDLGADVPMCLLPKPLRAQGTGTAFRFVDVPPVAALLVNPRVAVSTPDVFSALNERNNAPMPALPSFVDAPAFIDWLSAQRNDLENPALWLAPVIGEVLTTLRRLPGCRLARMSGSGATCFALFNTEQEARSAGRRLQSHQPDWWLAGGMLGDQTALLA